MFFFLMWALPDKICLIEESPRGCTTRTGYFKCREVKTGFYRNKSMQTGSSGTLIGWKSGQTTFVPLWDRMEGAWLRTLECRACRLIPAALYRHRTSSIKLPIFRNSIELIKIYNAEKFTINFCERAKIRAANAMSE
jgi:hypothetical protein